MTSKKDYVVIDINTTLNPTILPKLHQLELYQVYSDIERQFGIMSCLFDKDYYFYDDLKILDIRDTFNIRLEVVQDYLKKYIDYIGTKNYNIFCTLKEIIFDTLSNYKEIYIRELKIKNHKELRENITDLLLVISDNEYISFFNTKKKS